MTPIYPHEILSSIQKTLDDMLVELKKLEEISLIEKKLGEDIQHVSIQINILKGSVK